MISVTNEYSIYLYTGRADLRKGINGLSGIVRDELGVNPQKPKSIFIFSGCNNRVKKILVREYNRYELTTVRLDSGRFIKALTDAERIGGRISWSDYVMLTESAVHTNTRVSFL